MIPHRQVYWNIPHHNLLYIPFAVMAVLFAYGIARHILMWRRGRPVPLRRVSRRLGRLLVHGGAQSRVLKKRLPGISHLVLVLAYAVLTVGTIVVALNADLGLPVMQGPFYLWFESLGLDIAGLAAIFAVGALMFRRYVLAPATLRRTPMDFFLPSSLLVILITGFVLESLRLYVTKVPWAGYSPVGYAIAQIWAAFGLGTRAALLTHWALWWFHMLLAFAFMGAWPYSKLMHILFAPLSIFYADPEGRPKLPEVDFEGEAALGYGNLSDFTVKDLIDLDACTECGRCDEVCRPTRPENPSRREASSST